MSGQCVTLTRIGGEYFEFIGKVEYCKALYSGAKRTLKRLSSTTGERLMTVDLRIEGRNFPEFVIDIIPMVEKSDYKYIFSCAILNSSGSEVVPRICSENTLQEKVTLTWDYEKMYFERYGEYYLLNNTLSLLCEIAIQTGIKSEKIEKIEYETPSVEATNQKMSSPRNLQTSAPDETSPNSYEYDSKFHGKSQYSSSAAAKWNDNQSNPFPNVLDDFTAFYKKGILCDVKLQTATETFLAHKAILSARSPVFEAMFTSDMKEKIEECVRIEDVDAEIVKRMLLFLYSNSLEELKWEEAKKLYFAADKYQVLSLKHRCAVILKKNIDLSNCCELLLLADMHQDEDLKGAVQNYIAKHDKEVFLSVQWRNMEKSHPHLAIDILRSVHIKND